MKRHDLAVSKLVAGREKDRDFIREMHRHGMLDGQLVLKRIDLMPVAEDEMRLVRERWERIVRQ